MSMIVRSQKKAAAATLHLLLLVGVAALPSTTRAGAQMVPFLPGCNFLEVSLAPCMAASGGNISGACCSSLNRALDAGHRCACSLLLSNAVLASLVANLLPTLPPLLLPLPGCFLYAPSLAACQATTMQQQTSAPPTSTATPTIASTGDAALMADPPATVTPPSRKKKRRPSTEKSDGGSSTADNGTSEASPKPGLSVCRSNAYRRRPGNAGQGTAYTLTFLTAVGVSWINGMTVS